MVIQNDRDLQGMQRIGQICGLTLHHMLERVEPGMTTKQLDEIGAAFLAKHNAKSAPITAYRFPGHTCICLNEEAAHGIPRDDRVIQEGDMINVDVSAILEGYWGDCGASMPVPPANPAYSKLCRITRQALHVAIQEVKDGEPINNLGRAVEKFAKRKGYNILRQLSGHGVGRGIHEKPSIPNYYTRRARESFKDGMVITIEPFLTKGKGKVYTDEDGWTLRNSDGKVSAQYEHTVIVNGDDPILVTEVENSRY